MKRNFAEKCVFKCHGNCKCAMRNYFSFLRNVLIYPMNPRLIIYSNEKNITYYLICMTFGAYFQKLADKGVAYLCG